jgi:hypothetical protein
MNIHHTPAPTLEDIWRLFQETNKKLGHLL